MMAGLLHTETGSLYAAQAGIELTILQPQCPKKWDSNVHPKSCWATAVAAGPSHRITRGMTSAVMYGQQFLGIVNYTDIFNTVNFNTLLGSALEDFAQL
jgi:hypothetical protein